MPFFDESIAVVNYYYIKKVHHYLIIFNLYSYHFINSDFATISSR